MNPRSDATRSPRIVAFTSSSRGVGRTCALVNVACVLAANGDRVLVADNGMDAPRVHDYLRPFLAGDEPETDRETGAGLARALLVPPAHALSASRQYLLPIPGAAAIDCVVLDGTASPGSRPEDSDTGLREQVRASGYDYVLLDVSADSSEEMTKRLAYICDGVAICFHPRAVDISKAGTVATALAAHMPFRLDVVAVTLQFDDQDSAGMRLTKDRIERVFANVAVQGMTTDMAEIPYQPVDMLSDQAITVLHQQPGSETSDAYAAIAGKISAGRVARMRPMPAKARDSYRYSLGIGQFDTPPRIYLSYATDHRLWADWIQGVLEAGGAEVSRLPADHSQLPDAPSVLRIAHSRLPAPPTNADVVSVQVDDSTDAAEIDLRDCTAQQARRRLLRHFVLFDRSDLEPDQSVEFYPGDEDRAPGRSVIPPRDEQFAGRGAEIDMLRDHLRAGTGVVICQLDGEAGVGKSEIALEYAHRFAPDYDLIRWISAEDERSSRDALEPGENFHRWLLIYDNVPDPGKLSDLLPTHGNGHVIVTTRTVSSAGIHIGPLALDDSAELLSKLVIDLPPEHAGRIASLAARLPLTLRLVAAWLSVTAEGVRPQVASREAAAAWAADEFAARFEAQQDAGQEAQDPLAATISLITTALREDDLGRTALRLAQLCSWLSPDGVALRLLRSPAMLRILAADAEDGEALELDPLELDQVLHRGEQYELFRMNWERPARLTMHRLVQELIRDTQPQADAERSRQAVLSALAAFAPTDPEPEAPQDLVDFAELQRHLGPARATESRAIAVRRWLVDQVNYLIRLPGTQADQFAIELSERVLQDWRPETRAEYSLRMRLEFQLANLRRAGGEDARVLLLWEDGLLNGQQQLLGPTHPRTLKTWRSRGANLRGVGRFADSCAAEQRTLNGFRDRLGEFHPDTRRAANNLAYTYFLTGDLGSAVELEKQNVAVRRSLFGDDHPDVWVSATNLGVYLRELGDYKQADTVLKEAFQHVIALGPTGVDPALELRIRWHRAVLLRRCGKVDQAFEENRDTRRRMRDLFGPGDPRTSGCTLSFAIDYHRKGDTDTAIALLEESQRAFPSSDSKHVYTALHRLDMAVFKREGAAEVHAELAGWLGEDHPWTLAAKINQSTVAALSGAVEQADELLAEAYEECLEYLPLRHPYTELAAANLNAAPSDRDDIHVDLPF